MKLTGTVCLVLLSALLAIPQAWANGWEHGAIPYEALVKALSFEQPGTRRQAAQSLGHRGQVKALEPLIARLRAPEPDPRVRGAIYGAMGRLGDRGATDPLLVCLTGEERAEVRGECIAALARIGDRKALPHLLTLSLPAHSSQIRSAAVDALGSFAAPDSVARLSEIALLRENGSLGQRALRALGMTGTEAAAEPLLEALPLAEGDQERLIIVDALGRTGAPVAHKPLKQLYEASDDPVLRGHVTFALASIRGDEAFATLLDLLSDPLPAVRFFALKGLRKIGDARALDRISALSLEISERLGAMDDADLLRQAEGVETELGLQVEALSTITELDAQRGLTALLAAAGQRSLDASSADALKLAQGFYRSRRAALHGLGYSGSAEALALLSGEQGANAPDFRLRAVAVRSLGVLELPGSYPTVLPALEDPVAEVRWTAAAVLGLLGEAAAVPKLLRRLEDPVAEVRRQTALSLGYLAAAEARDALERMAAQDSSPPAREAAALAVELLGR